MPPTKRKEESVTVSDVFAVCKEIQANQTELSSKISHVDQKLESIETIVHGVLVECNGADGEAAEKLNRKAVSPAPGRLAITPAHQPTSL